MTEASESAFAEEENLCVATLDDYQAVVAIDHDVYCGLDDLPDKYPCFVQGLGVRGFLYKIGERVVGFLSTEVVDGGQTLLTTAGRIAPDCRGKGLYSRFTRRVLQQFSGSRELRYVAMTVDNVILAEYEQQLMKTYTVVMQKLTFDAGVHIPTLTKTVLEQMPGGQGLSQLSPCQIAHMINSGPTHLRHLFPEGRLLLSSQWKAYRIMPENTDRILENKVFVASAEAVLENSPCFPVSLLTCGSYYFCRKGLNYDMDIFGTGSEKELRAHIQWHLRRLVSLTEKEEAVLSIVYPEEISDAVSRLREILSITCVFPYNREVLLEREFPR